MQEQITRSPKAALALVLLVGTLFLVQIGALISNVLADGQIFGMMAIAADVESDKVGATAAEFRVDESGAATYSIPIYGVPGTAGVSPKLSLNYSSQGGYGPLGKGWSIGGLSSITRCRSTREAGDFIANGVPVDGSPAPVNFTATDRYCLDGQRLIPAQAASATCAPVGGMTFENLRTEIESFQRVCAYAPNGGNSGVAFFTVERKDGSTSWYGDRAASDTQNLAYNGYVNSTAPGKQAFALSWAQTRFQDSTGNYIDYLYWQLPGGGEHLITGVRYTGKNVLSGQTGSAAGTYARFEFDYELRAATHGYVSGGRVTQARRLRGVFARGEGDAQARFYRLAYGASVSGSGMDTLTSLQECRDDSAGATCLPPTTFEWSQAKHEFLNGASWAPGTFGSAWRFEGFKLGDVDGDGRQDMVWFKDGPGGGNPCGTENIFVSWGVIGADGRPSFGETTFGGCTIHEMPEGDSGAWQLFDYNGDGRDDLFILGPEGDGHMWVLFPSQGRQYHVFNTSQNLIAPVWPAIWANYTGSGAHPQLADLNGDGVLDVLLPPSQYTDWRLQAKISSKTNGSYSWGTNLDVVSTQLPQQRDCNGTTCYLQGVDLQNPNGNYQLLDFDGDSRSDLLLQATYAPAYEPCSKAPAAPDENGAYKLSAGASDTNLLPPDDYCPPPRPTRIAYAMRVVAQTSNQIQIEPYALLTGLGYGKYADFNGDGLTDMLGTGTSGWQVHYNTGTGFSSPVVIGELPFSNKIFTHDVTGDGRADIEYLNGTSYSMRSAQPDGSFGPEQPVPGQGAFACVSYGCDPNTYVNIFSDMDADGAMDYFALHISDNPVYYVSQSAPSDRGKPRDVITGIQNGLGARTEISYNALTNADVHRRDAGSRNAVTWGRGSAVQDFNAPMYVVTKASSSAPSATNPVAMASLYYRYSGAKIQAGGRGFLGFREIWTIDPNQNGGHVVTKTEYHQDFPFTGMPRRTFKSAIAGAYYPPWCLANSIQEGCYATPGEAFAEFGGNTFSNNVQFWQADIDVTGEAFSPFSVGVQAPAHVRVLGTDEKLHDPASGETTSRVMTTFTYGAYGNATGTSVDTYTGETTLTSTLLTSNAYAADDAAKWRLGRLTASTVTHKRPGRADVVRSSAFEYAMSGPATGLLTAEITQPNGTFDQKLRKEYGYDAFGNRMLTETCAAPAIDCSSTISFHPSSLTTVQRYSRVTFDGVGRYPLATYEPFWTPSGGAEQITQTVSGRNIFGDVTQAFDANGADTLAVTGALGRPYYSWAEVVPGSVPGDPSGGVESFTTYRWCGGGIDCPAGAKFRQKVVAEGAPTQWTYLDVLGRPILKAAQTFNANVADADVSAVCTDYDGTGKSRRVSNPFFLPGVAADGPTGLAAACSNPARLWITTTTDMLGRPVNVTSPKDGGGVTTVTMAYNGRRTTVTNPRHASFTTTKVVNGKGELEEVIDAGGLSTSYWYQADGSNYLVKRNAGRGDVDNSFVFDTLGRKTLQDDPDSGLTRFEYNALGEVVAQTDAENNRIENKIDARGRVWQRTVMPAGSSIQPESASTFTFDTAANGLGKLASETITGIYAAWSSNPAPAFNFTRGYAYDTLGRPAAATTVIDGTSYPSAAAYDGLGRPFRAQDASGQWSKTEIDPRGFGRALCPSNASDNVSACGSSWQRTTAMDAWGHVTSEIRSAGGQLPVTRTYRPATGRIERICADKPGAGDCELVNEQYAWDEAGNLSTRLKDTRYLETFYYDALDRLTSGFITMRNGVPTQLETHWSEYDKLGNVCGKMIDNVATPLGYDGRAGCGVSAPHGTGSSSTTGPHRANRIIGGPHDAWLTYDGRGNQIFRDATDNAKDRTIRYSGDNHAFVIIEGPISAPSTLTRYWYGPDGQRYRRQDTMSGKETYYLGNVEVVKQGGVTTFKRNLGGVVLQTVVNGVNTNQFLFHDQLGSVVRITDGSGNSIEHLDYNPSGERRRIADPLQTYEGSPALTNRGFTGHEHVEADVIHMNGRVYDPVLGRFLQPDPLIQAPDSAQSWNAYTYVFNNPLSYTDPTGLWGRKEQNGLRMAIAVGISIWTGGAAAGLWGGAMTTGAAFATAMVGGFAAGVIGSNGSLKAGLIGAFGAGMTFGIGQMGLGPYQTMALQAFSGGIMESLQGGNFGNGFIAAGLTAAVMPHVGGIRNDVARTAVGALVGGTISDMTGGKFANGAVSGAIQGAMAGSGESQSLSAEEQAYYDQGKYNYETALAFDPPSIPQGVVDAAAGFGDTISFGGTKAYREWRGIGSVDYSSGSYTAGEVAGVAYTVAAGGVGGLSGGARSVFWSGEGNMQRAAALGRSLERTPVGAVMNALGERVPYGAWKAASSIYARNASGTAIKVGTAQGNIWRTIEQPILNARRIPIKTVP